MCGHFTLWPLWVMQEVIIFSTLISVISVVLVFKKIMLVINIKLVKLKIEQLYTIVLVLINKFYTNYQHHPT